MELSFYQRLYWQTRSLKKELNVEMPFNAIEKWFEINPKIFKENPLQFKNKVRQIKKK
jgi:hypothetical protein